VWRSGGVGRLKKRSDQKRWDVKEGKVVQLVGNGIEK